MLKVTSGMLAISQETLMKLLEISEKKTPAACLAACTVELHFNAPENGRKKERSDLYGCQWSRNSYFVTIVF